MQKYELVVGALKAGDVVTFGNGKSFVLGELLGSGSFTRVYAIANDPAHAIRIPWGEFAGSFGTQFDMMSAFVEGIHQLEKQNVPAVKVQEEFAGQYAVVNRLENLMTLETFINRSGSMPQEKLNRMIKAMDLFAAQTALFKDIGDLHSANLVYVPGTDRWLVMDTDDTHDMVDFEHVRANGVMTKRTIFRSMINPAFLPRRQEEFLSGLLERWQGIAMKARDHVLKQTSRVSCDEVLF